MTYSELVQRSGSVGIKTLILAMLVAQEDIDVTDQLTFSIVFFTYAQHVYQMIVFKSTLSMQIKYYVIAS